MSSADLFRRVRLWLTNREVVLLAVEERTNEIAHTKGYFDETALKWRSTLTSLRYLDLKVSDFNEGDIDNDGLKELEMLLDIADEAVLNLIPET